MAAHPKMLSRRILPALQRISAAHNGSFVNSVTTAFFPTLSLCKFQNNTFGYRYFQSTKSLYKTVSNNTNCGSRCFPTAKSPYNSISNLLNPPSVIRNVTSIRSISFGGREKDKPVKKRVPKLLLLQNPFTWLMIKIDFRVLRHIWDPTFVEKEFKFGTKQAVSRVTQVISSGQFVELNGLLTRPARASLLREMERNWNERQRSLLALNRDDIQISSPRKVYFIRIAGTDKKYCDVDMSFLALKWTPINSVPVLLFTEIFARFHREYTPHTIPEWTIAYFKVTRFEVLRRH